MWDVVTSLGGKTRYFYMNWIWTLRGLMDWRIGGPGFTRGRRDAVWGPLYWAVMVPFHLFIFKGMRRAIARRAEALDGSSAGLTKA